MDFAALMNKELSKSKKSSTNDDKKYMKRSEVEAERKATYLAEQKALEAERATKAEAKRKREEEVAAENALREDKRRKLAEESKKRQEEKEWEEEQARRKRLGLPELVKGEENGDKSDGDAADDIPDDELIQKLRELGQPAILFGESHAARLRRHKKLTTVLTTGPIPTTLKLVEEKDMKVDGAVPKDKEGRLWLFRQLASYFTMVLTEYEKAMEEEKRETSASKMAYSAMVQTRENMKPVRSPPHILTTENQSITEERNARLTLHTALPQVRVRRPRRLPPPTHHRNRPGPPGAPLRRRKRRLPAPQYRQGRLAHRRHHGGYPRA